MITIDFTLTTNRRVSYEEHSLSISSEYLIIITGDKTIGIIHPISCEKGLGLVNRKRDDHGIVQ